MSNRMNVTFLNPTTGQNLEVELEDSITATQAINEMIAGEFIPDNTSRGGYTLLVKNTQKTISGSQTLADGGVQEGSVIRVIPATDAGI